MLGGLLGDFFQHPEVFGLDYAITAMFIFLAISQFEGITKSKLRVYLYLVAIVIVMMLLLSLFLRFVFSNFTCIDFKCDDRDGD
ncbi:hypothetical protein K9F08_12345 [Staphylococcus pseudintermedius]|nr:hypothetical protein K9F08_12345 [Staphylococcus pseudintermedius]